MMSAAMEMIDMILDLLEIKRGSNERKTLERALLELREEMLLETDELAESFDANMLKHAKLLLGPDPRH